jgi:c-di-GMP-binding flagellar brake protein YcgR
VARITESAVSIRFPDLKALPAGATVGSSALLKIANNCGVQSASCQVLEAEHTPVVYVKLAAPQHLTITQNRKFFRLPLFIKAKPTVKVSKNQALLNQSDPNAMTEDISAGGTRLNSTLALVVGDTAVITLRLPLRRGEDGDFTSPCIVRRVVLNTDKANRPFQIGVEFNSANRRDEDALMAAMFELQRRARGG